MTENPFPATAAESGRPVDPGAAVPTRSLRTGLDLFRAYLRGDGASHPFGQRGEVLAVTGGAGTGKTLVTSVLRGEAAAAPPALSVYLLASSPKVGTLLRPFAESLRADSGIIRTSVRQIYAQLIADGLSGWEPAAPVVDELRAGRVADPAELVQALGLMESDFLQRLENRLRELTSDPAMATALALLLRPGFDGAVWDWLSGGEPAEVLRDRGITKPLTGDTETLVAMGALVAVVCATGRKLLIVLDELELVFVDRRQVSAAIATGFRRFLATATDAGAFIVLAGLPSFLAALPNQVRDRIGTILEMAPFRGADVQQLIESRSTPAFAPAVMRSLEDLTDGVPRSILALCNRLVRVSGDAVIGAETVREAARVYVEEHDGNSFADRLARILTTQGWAFERNVYLGEPDESHVDFWVELGGEGESCAILIADNILEQLDQLAQSARVLTVKELRPDADIIILVMGFLSSAAANELTDLAGTEPVVAHPGRLAVDLQTALRGLAEQLSEADRDPLERVDRRVRQVGRGQSRTQAYAASVALTVRGMRDDQNRALQGVVARLEQLVPGSQSATGPDQRDVAPTLPPVVEAMLTSALSLLQDLLDRVDDMLADVFRAPADRARDERTVLRLRLQNNVAEATGAVAFLQRLIVALRDALRIWYAGEGPATALDDVILTYNVALEFVSVYQLDQLRQITARFAGDQEELRAPTAVGVSEFRAPQYFGELPSKLQAELTGPAARRRR